MISQSNRYFKSLLQHLSNSSKLDLAAKNRYWLKEYEKFNLYDAYLNIEKLPEIMPLIFPDFLYNETGEFIGDYISYKSTAFNSGINLSDKCQFASIHINGICEFNSYKTIRGKCQADHHWPHSLGGPSIIDNRVLLCRFHNLAKSNSILNDFWLKYPIWLNDYIKRMYDLKN
jgi:hypothetical protein